MINEAIRLIRVFHDMSSTKLAEQLGISQSYLSEIEAGKKEVSLDLIRKYAQVFGISQSSILFFSETYHWGRKKDPSEIRKALICFLKATENFFDIKEVKNGSN